MGCNYKIKFNNDRGILHLAAIRGNEYFISYLNNYDKLEVNGVDDAGRTPLHLAILYKNVETAKLLIQLSNNLDTPDSERYSPLHLAAYVQNYPIIKHLLINGASKKNKDLEG